LYIGISVAWHALDNSENTARDRTSALPAATSAADEGC
jgi:hypothetical protein